MYGNLRIYMFVTIPDLMYADEYKEKKVCIAQRCITREKCEQYLDLFKRENNLDRNTITAEWTAVERIFA